MRLTRRQLNLIIAVLQSDAGHEEATLREYPHLETPDSRKIIEEQKSLAAKLKALRDDFEDAQEFTLE